jgi:hypothetical protein
MLINITARLLNSKGDCERGKMRRRHAIPCLLIAWPFILRCNQVSLFFRSLHPLCGHPITLFSLLCFRIASLLHKR